MSNTDSPTTKAKRQGRKDRTIKYTSCESLRGGTTKQTVNP